MKISELDDNIENFSFELSKLKNQKQSQIKQKEIKSLKNKLNLKKDKKNGLLRDIRKYEVEIHKKYAIAFACIFFVLIGVPIGMMTKTSGVGMAFSVSSIIFLLYYGSLTLGEEFADKGVISPFLAMWISNIIFGIVGIYLTIISVKEMKFIDLNKLKKMTGKIFR